MIYFNLFACWCFWSVRKRLIYDLLWNVANSGLLTLLTFSFSPAQEPKFYSWMVDCCDPYLLSGGSRLARFSIWTRTSLKYKGSVNRFALPQLWHSIMFYVMSRLWTLKLNVCLFKWIETKEALFFPCYLLTYFSYCQPLLHIWTFSISFIYLYNMLQKISIVLRIYIFVI